MIQKIISYTAAKAWAAAIGGVLTAATTALATVQLVLSDDKVDLAEISTLITAVAVFGSTVYAVWKTENKPKGVPPVQTTIKQEDLNY